MAENNPLRQGFLKEFLVSLHTTRGKDKRAPLVVEAVIWARDLADAKRQVEENDVQALKVLYYGHSTQENFKPNRKGTEGDFETFLGIATTYNVKPNTGEDRRD